jgi:hypothetical protein
MATSDAIGATSEALIRLLSSACPTDQFPGAVFQLYQATDFQKPMSEGVSLFLYRVAVNTSRRNLPALTAPDGQRYQPPLPVDLYYLLSVWGKTPERQHRLLGFCMRELQDVPTLPAGFLNQNEAQPDTFRPREAIEIVCDPLSLMDLAQLWDVLKPNVPLSVSYVVRFVPLESKLRVGEYGLVQTRELAAESIGAE